MYRKNDICELDVVSVTNLGYGVGKNGDNPVVFVPGTVTGERIEAVIIKVCRDYCIGRLKRVIMTSELKENRQVCHAPASCGGCPYRYLKYDEELRIKRENVVAEFRKAGIGDITVCPVEYVKDGQGNPVIYGYRNKAQYRFVKTKNGISAGFYASGTHRVTGDADCPLQPGIFAGITSFICEYAEKHGLSVYDETTGKGTLRHLYIRGSADKKSICVCLVINARGLECSADLGKKLTDRFPQITGFVINENLSDSNLILGDKYDVIIGADGITDVFCGKIFDVRMAAFYQVNHDAAELLCGIARDLVSRVSACRRNSVFLDLYCGIGTIGLSAALPSQKLIGVEIVPEAVECAKRNAVRNGVCNAEFICADSFEGAADYLRTLTAGDIVCVDPPRKGCTEELLRAVDRSGARNMLYISCNPATLARDCAVMKSLGWYLSDAHPVDLFPRTGHVETVCLLSRETYRPAKDYIKVGIDAEDYYAIKTQIRSDFLKDISWELELNEYIRQGEPDRVDKSNAWKTAIGLQDVDGLKTSEYLISTAKEHIEGKITISEADRRIQSYYEERQDRTEIEADTKEADIVSVRIAKLLGENTFQFSPVEWQNIHRKLFEGVFKHAGKIRDYNITKKEWVLKGDTVTYASYDSIRATLDYDFSQEKNFSYDGLTIEESVRHIAKFTSGIWQIHPFGEGNTRSTAVFIIKYLKTFGFNVSNETFAENSWFFRNALVRANYSDWQNGIHATTEFLELFFENLLMNVGHELKNRYMHIDFQSESATQSDNESVSKCQNGTLELSLEELAIINVIMANPSVTQKQIAEMTGKSERTIKRRTVEMQDKRLISRENGKRNGKWKVLIKL